MAWSSLFERQRRVVTAASMMARNGRVQREGDVIHILAENLEDISGLLGTIGDREEGLSAPHEPGDGATYPGRPNVRESGSGRRPP